MSSPSLNKISTAPLPLAMIGAGLGLAALPVLDQAAVWTFLLVIFTIAVRLFLFRSKRRLPSLPVKLLVLAVGFGGVMLQFGAIMGVEAGLSVLLILVALKLLEANSQRDLQVLTLLGFFLSLCNLFFSQDLGRWVYVAGVLAWLTFTLVFSHSSGVPGGLRASIKTTLLLFVQALPLICILFLFFPRMYGGFRFQFSRSIQGATGMSDQMRPGSMASLALLHDNAFHVSFPDGNLPPQADLYWRGVVLWRGDGLTWVRDDTLPADRRTKDTVGGTAVRQRIVLQPHGGRWLFALDRPAGFVQGATFQPGGFIQRDRPISFTIWYDVLSRSENREKTLPKRQLEQALQVPANVSARVRALAESWRVAAKSDEDVVSAALAFFRNSGFAYSLTPGVYGQNELEVFLFDRRLGFCEHYAGAFASLMRMAGVPSRVVIGYHGGQFNRHGNMITVRQSDAHAWAEVWIKDKGWQRVDPTSVIAPERINEGFDSFLEAQGAQGADGGSRSNRFGFWQNFVRDGRLLWDSLAYRWDLWVLNFDEETQKGFLLMLGLGAWDWGSLAGIVSISIVSFIAAIGLWLRFASRKRQDPTTLWYGRFCRHLSSLGVTRELWEGPQQFTLRAASLLPRQSIAIRRAGELYVLLRYTAVPPRLEEFIAAVRTLETHRAKE